MNTARITLTANAGIIIETGQKTVLIDALHEEDGVYGGLNRDMQEKLWQRFELHQPDLYICTHKHPDHHSEDLVRQAKERWNKCVFLVPDHSDSFTFNGDGFTLQAVRTPHDGKKLRNEPNHAFFLQIGSLSTLAPGDCSTRDAACLTELTHGKTVDLAVLNFPWITLNKARRFVDESLRPRSIAIVHLPHSGSDMERYCAAALAAAEKSACEKAVVLTKFLQDFVVDY